MAIPFRVMIYDKAYTPKGPLGDIRAISAEIFFNKPGGATITTGPSGPRVTDLLAAGARATLDYRHPDADSWLPLLSGRIKSRAGSGLTASTSRIFDLVDDWAVLNQIQGWPNPTGDIDEQGVEDAYYTITGPAETVLKDVVAKNAARVGIELTIPESEGRGDTITASFRFHPIVDRLFPAIDNAGIGVRIIQDGTSRTLEVYEPATYPYTLTEESGIVRDPSWQMIDPTATRAVVAGSGQGTARVLRQYIDSDLETSIGEVLETYVDARDLDPADMTSEAFEAAMSARGADALAEGAPVSTITAKLSETANFRFAKIFNIGDQVPIQPMGGPILTDRIREVDFDWATDSDLVVTPLAGDWSESTDSDQYKQAQLIARDVRDLQRSM